MLHQVQDTICAIATPAGVGAIAVIRLSGEEALNIVEKVFRPAQKDSKLSQQPPYTIHYGSIYDSDQPIDDVLVSVFKAPRSYTGENSAEISCHGSMIIQQELLQLLIKNGARMADPGEFTLRAFLNGKMDLSQAEAVADLIASSSEASRKVAMQQMRGGFTRQLQKLRDRLLYFISLIELELDFGEEDVEFADKSELKALVNNILDIISVLTKSFGLGNVIKNGVPVAIVGEPNVGKSTLLNLLLQDDKAIVSEIAGTTRDVIEDVISLNGLAFRFIDTAGIRETTDTIESLGIERTHAKINQAAIVLLLLDARNTPAQAGAAIEHLVQKQQKQARLIAVVNKTDLAQDKSVLDELQNHPALFAMVHISAKQQQNVDKLEQLLISAVDQNALENDHTIITNVRHYEALRQTGQSLERVIAGLDGGLSNDFIAQDIREALHYLGEITGEITTDEILGNIFKNFCIGK